MDVLGSNGHTHRQLAQQRRLDGFGFACSYDRSAVIRRSNGDWCECGGHSKELMRVSGTQLLEASEGVILLFHMENNQFVKFGRKKHATHQDSHTKTLFRITSIPE